MGRMLRSLDIANWDEEDGDPGQNLPGQHFTAFQGKPVLGIAQLDALERAGDEDPWARRQYDRFWPWPGGYTPGQ